MTISECLQMTYHQSLKNHVILLYARDILLIDLQINMTVGIISIDKSNSPLLQVLLKGLGLLQDLCPVTSNRGVVIRLELLKSDYKIQMLHLITLGFCRLSPANRETFCTVYTNLAA